jgi:poly(3-hydroxybutyrate) depolymerase
MRSLLIACFVIGCSSSSGEGATPDLEAGGDDVSTDDSSATTDTATTSDAPAGDSSPTTDGMTGMDAVPETGAESSSGCGVTPAMAAGVTDGTITVDGTMRTYVLSIPMGYDGKTPLPLAFGWHGRTGNGKLFRAYSGVETAGKGKAIFVYPDGLTVTPSNPKDTGWELTPGGRDLKLYDALLADLEKKLCVDTNKVWSFGHSFGGYMSNFLGCQRGGKTLHGIGLWAGGLAGTSGCGKTPAWIGHAEDDPTVPFTEGTKARDFWVKTDGCGMTTKATDPSPCVAYDGCGTNPVTWCDAKTGGHNWPTIAGPGIWSFFSKL